MSRLRSVIRVRRAVLAATVVGFASLSYGVGTESFTATVLPAGDPPPRTWEGASALTPMQISVHIDKWSTSEEIRRIKTVLDQDGPDAAARLIRSANVGKVIPPPHVAFGIGFAGGGREPTWRLVLAYARQTPVEREILLIADRPLDVYDTSTVEPRNADNLGFGAIALGLDNNGRGKGRILPRARVQFLDNGGIALVAPPPSAPSYAMVEVRALAK